MNEKKARRRYTREFKLEAIRLLENRGGKVTEVAHSLGIHPNILQRWIREFRTDPAYSFPGNGNLRTPDEETCLLQKRLRDAEEDRDILKKALAIFSKKVLKYQFIHDHRDPFSLKRLCEVLLVSRSAYYQWLASTPSKWEQENVE